MSIRRKAALIIMGIVLIAASLGFVTNIIFYNLNVSIGAGMDVFLSSLIFLAAGLLISIIASPFVARPFVKIEKNTAEILEARKRTNLLLNAMPLSCQLWNSNYEIFYCNDENLRLFNIESAQIFLDTHSCFSPEYQPDGELSSKKQRMYLQRAFAEGKYSGEWMHQMPDGAQIPSEITLVRIPFDDENVVAAYVRDLREQKKIIGEIEQRDSLLDTINNAAAILLKSEIDEFESNLLFCMKMIADAMNLNRVYIWKNHENDGKIYHTQMYEWTDRVRTGQKTVYAVDIKRSGKFPEWEAVLASGKCINGLVRDLPAEAQIMLNSRETQSIFLMPVFLHDEFWGFIGYDDCCTKRVFTENEQSILCSAGNVFSYAVFQNEMAKDFQQGMERFSSEETCMELLRSYHLHTQDMLEKLKKLGTPEISLNEYAVIVHGIKGSSYGISANCAGREAEKLETAAKAGDFEEVKKRNGAFIEMMEALLFSMGKLLENNEEMKYNPVLKNF